MSEQVIAITILACVCAALSGVLNIAVIRICHKYGILDKPGMRKRHKNPTPNIGGVAILLSVVITLMFGSWIYPEILLANDIPWVAIGLAGFLIFAVGFVDDLRPVPPFGKLFVQTISGLIVYSGGLAVDPIYLPFWGELTLGGWSALETVFWVVALSNAINLIDGLDGLALGVSLIGAVSLMMIALALNLEVVLTICAILSGALAGSLYFNLHPARIFLGDSGSLLIGFIFATLSLLVPIKSYTTAALFPPLIALGIPLIETASSVLRRFFAGRSVFAADRRHLFHYLGYLGLGPRATVRVFWLGGVLCGATSIAMLFWDRRLALGALLGVMVVVFLVFLILRPRLNRAELRIGARGELDKSGSAEAPPPQKRLN